jgi:hypothetical protein
MPLNSCGASREMYDAPHALYRAPQAPCGVMQSFYAALQGFCIVL